MLLVTGITGHSGGFFLQELIDNKYEEHIKCVVRDTSDTSLIDRSGLDIEKVYGDLQDQDFLNKEMAGVDTVLHIASIFHSIKVTKAAVNNRVKRLILVHTTGIYSKYKSASEEYLAIESEIKDIVKGSDTNIIILRPTMIYGNVSDNNMIIFIRMVDKLRLFPVIDKGSNYLQPVNGRDLGKAYYQILNSDKITYGDYILSGDKPISMRDMFTLISSILGKKIAFLNVPMWLGVFGARTLKVLSLGKIDYIEKVQRMGEDRNFSHDEAANDFGYSPMSFEEGLRIEIKQYQNLSKAFDGDKQ